MSARGRASMWDGILPGPATRSNGGCSDCSPGGSLVAYGAGSCVVVVDPRSMQLVCVLPMPPASSSSSSSSSSQLLQQQLPLLLLSPFPAASASASFVTAVRWSPQPLSHDLSSYEDPSSSHLRLAVGDRQGRIALWDLRSRQVVLWFDLDSGSRQGIQDLCWIRSDSWLLASIHGPSLLVLWDAATGRCIWKYDAAPEYLCCIRRDPFDSRHFCALSLHGFLLSAIALGGEGDVSLQEHRINGISDPLEGFQRSEKESANSPALVAYPLFFASLSFSPLWRNVLFVTFPRELLSFDLQYGASLSLNQLPRSCGKFLDLIPDPELDLLYCAHLDGKISIWKRKSGEQAHVLCTMEELMPSIGSTVPSPSMLAIALCQSESSLRTMRDDDISFFPSDDVDTSSGSKIARNKYIMVISDDGKIWQWSLDFDEDTDTGSSQKVANQNQSPSQIAKESALDAKVRSADNGTSTSISVIGSAPSPRGNPTRGTKSLSKGSGFSSKMNLIGQLHLLSSTVTTLAVPSPSLLATLARGGNNPAPAVPLVAVGTQSGAIDIIDIIANAVTVSFSVHNSAVKGLRWLGNSRLVSFSYSQVNDKGGGYTNRLTVTCVRSGLNRPFRVLQKPERAPIRALRASSSGRYLVILFRDAPVEVWAMTKNPIMLRSLALPFTVLEWTLPAVPRPTPTQNGGSARQPSPAPSADSRTTSSDQSSDDTSESFAFALVNGALGVFEVHGRRIRDFRPKWPSSTFAPSDGLVTAMAYRLPHVVMGDRLGNIRWWDVTTGLSSSFNTHKEGIRRIKFSPVVTGDRSRGRITVLFHDNTFSIFDLDTPDPMANSLLQPQSPGTLVLELDWLPMRTNKGEPLVLCIAGADSSFRLVEISIDSRRNSASSMEKITAKEIYRPVPLCTPVLFPTAHALALRMILQMGVKTSWFNYNDSYSSMEMSPSKNSPVEGDLRSYMIETGLPTIGDPVVAELLLKVLEPYRKEGCIIDEERAREYEKVVKRGATDRFAFAAAIFGELSEALFWLQLPRALLHFLEKSSLSVANPRNLVLQPTSHADNGNSLDRIPSFEMSAQTSKKSSGQLSGLAFKKEELWLNAKERISWHDKLDSEEAIQKRVHELVSVGNLEGAVSLLLSTPPEGAHFYPNALRAVVLSSAVSRSLHELAVKVVAANMVRTDKSLSGIHLLCAVGRYQEACSQLQDAGCWTDAATLAATHLHGSDYFRVLQRWADYVLHYEHNIWRALILYVAAGAMTEALAALRKSKQPDTAALFLLACHEIYTKHLSSTSSPETEPEVVDGSEEENAESEEQEVKMKINFPGKNVEDEDIATVSEFFGQYQRKLIHLCLDTVHSIE
ncbi:WD repeat-containing protein 11 isoform X1 [Carex littledalei]|uniref:WD repeat-containing protein 11 isoform X1 n=1 Tax=Carex littledalei TaxID=544730 RepID=A0A833R3F1_9POAL|nr:WD repeat-containing protein 11 isoform X1 [Carex littledalei]